MTVYSPWKTIWSHGSQAQSTDSNTGLQPLDNVRHWVLAWQRMSPGEMHKEEANKALAIRLLWLKAWRTKSFFFFSFLMQLGWECTCLACMKLLVLSF